MVITADCGSANPGSIPGGGNFLLSFLKLYKSIVYVKFYEVKETHHNATKIKKSTLKNEK